MKFNLQIKGLKLEAINGEKRFGFNLDEINYAEELTTSELETVLTSCKEVLNKVIEEVKAAKQEETKSIKNHQKSDDAEYLKYANEAENLLNQAKQIVALEECNYESVSKLLELRHDSKILLNNIQSIIQYDAIKTNDANYIYEVLKYEKVVENVVENISKLYENNRSRWINEF